MKWIEDNFKYIIGIVGILAGFAIIGSPEKVPDFLIILIGVYWLFEGIITIFEEYDKNR